MAGIPVTIATDALVSALNAFGARRVATFSPYTQLMSDHSRRFLTESGFEVVRNARIPDCPDALVIAEVDQDRIFAAMREADGPDVDALVQIGANLAIARLVDEAERVHRKPVLGINTLMFWDALRRAGIKDRLEGWGRLMAEH
jgi:maleate isomerase